MNKQDQEIERERRTEQIRKVLRGSKKPIGPSEIALCIDEKWCTGHDYSGAICAVWGIPSVISRHIKKHGTPDIVRHKGGLYSMEKKGKRG